MDGGCPRADTEKNSGTTADWEETPEEGRGVFFFYLISEMYEAQRSIHPPPPPPLGFSKTPAPCPFFHRDLSLPLPFRSPRGINTPPIVLTRDPLPPLGWDNASHVNLPLILRWGSDSGYRMDARRGVSSLWGRVYFFLFFFFGKRKSRGGEER